MIIAVITHQNTNIMNGEKSFFPRTHLPETFLNFVICEVLPSIAPSAKLKLTLFLF